VSIHQEYDRQHLEAVKAYQEQVSAAYYAVIDRIFAAAVGLQLRAEVFRITDYPSLEALLDRELALFAEQLGGIVVNGIKGQWELSQTKFGAMVSHRYGAVAEPLQAVVFNPHARALEQFKKRKIEGLNLSDRIWNYTKQFRAEIEQTLFTGIEEGTSARKMAADMKQYLKDPDKLFRRVRDAKGKLQLSKAAREYKPEPGKYRSSYKNALRVTRTEINGAYRKADVTRWQNSPFVIGYRTRLSNRHPKHDICDVMAGQTFPTSFVWGGWHAQCLCSLIPILAEKEEFRAYQDAVLAGTDADFKFKDAVTDMPEGFNTYVKENMQTFQRWKSLPMFLKDNPSVRKAFESTPA